MHKVFNAITGASDGVEYFVHAQSVAGTLSGEGEPPMYVGDFVTFELGAPPANGKSAPAEEVIVS